jgi:hypothetical protein
MAAAFDIVSGNNEIERFRYTDSAFDFNASARCRQVVYGATDAAAAIDYNGAGLQ